MQDRKGSDSDYLAPMPHSHICARFPAAGLGLRCSVSGPPSCILHRASCILYRASCILHLPQQGVRCKTERSS
jgi:hypothetical protein